MNTIKIQNAKIHNLKNIDVEIPRNKFTVVTGISGSGKSSLVYDVLYKKARDIYLDSIGIRRLHREDTADSIQGLCPVVAVEQRTVRALSSRSVVGTRTNIFEYLRQLFASIGARPCKNCGNEVVGMRQCPQCKVIPEPFPKGFFSFNTINGKCETCEGRGYTWAPSLDKILLNRDKSIQKTFYFWLFRPAMEKFPIIEKQFNISLNTRICDLDENARNAVLFGWGDFPGFFGSAAAYEEQVNFLMTKCPSAGPGILERYYERRTCPSCQGARLGKEPLSVRINGKNMGEVSSMTMEELGSFLEELKDHPSTAPFEKNLILSMQRQIEGFRQVNLSYLSLYRTIPTLSGGEIQRLYIMQHITSNLKSALFIFDEPTAGLHEIEKHKLILNIKNLSNTSNGLIIVEHDVNTIKMAEHIIDLGPLAGKQGGTVVYNGPIEGIFNCDKSYTGAYLSGRMQIPSRLPPHVQKVTEKTPALRIHNACANNLKGMDVDIPLGMIVGIAGVSGSGKSTLVSKVLIPLLHRFFREMDEIDNPIDIEADADDFTEEEVQTTLDGKTTLSGTEHIDGYADVAQIPISRFGTSTPLSYLGLWERIRKVYAKQPAAAERKWTASHFSFNSKGACPECKGRGVKRTGFPPYGYFECEVCNGKRFNEEVLQVQYKGLNIYELQQMSIAEAADFFSEDTRITKMLQMLEKTGLGYMSLGQPLPTLSCGEAQRLKIAKELGVKRKGSFLYILDEPTTGLSFYDIAKLLPMLQELVQSGNSVLIVEHDPEVLSFCDYIIEMGPGAGMEGGYIIAKGSPFQLKRNKASQIGPFLKGAHCDA